MPLFDILTFAAIFILLGAIFYFSNKEMRKSLEQTRHAHSILAQDKEYLETKVQAHLDELRESRLARMDELSKAAEFGRLSQGLFHDLMSPLTSLVHHTEKQNIEKAMEASDRMSKYMQDIRSTLRREEEQKICSVSDELESTLRLLAYKARENNVKINTNVDENITWYGDPLKLRQIFSNLISNAIDSFDDLRKRQGNAIHISINPNQNHCTIKIEDNGCGIEKENLDKIFNQFYTTKPADRGTGIGLTTVKSVVEKILKGKIEVESHKNKGTIFTITFPKNN